jgi:hypothetical protein
MKVKKPLALKVISSNGASGGVSIVVEVSTTDSPAKRTLGKLGLKRMDWVKLIESLVGQNHVAVLDDLLPRNWPTAKEVWADLGRTTPARYVMAEPPAGTNLASHALRAIYDLIPLLLEHKTIVLDGPGYNSLSMREALKYVALTLNLEAGRLTISPHHVMDLEPNFHTDEGLNEEANRVVVAVEKYGMVELRGSQHSLSLVIPRVEALGFDVSDNIVRELVLDG